MAIRIIEGCIGSGKTYYAVWHILSNYYKFDSSIDNYIPKDPDKPVFIFSNIDRFVLSQSLDDRIKEAGGLQNFFNSEYQKEFCRDKKVIYVIDEAQSPNFFHRKFYNPNVFFFFQYHRHYGCDIYLITQDVWTLAKELQNLAEYYIKAQRRTYSMLGEFRYKYCSPDGESFRSKTLKRSKEIFALYSSMSQDEVEKMPSASRRFALVFLILILLAVFVFKYGFLNLFYTSSASAVASHSSHSPPSPPSPSFSLIASSASAVASHSSHSPPSPPSLSPPKSYDDYLKIVQGKIKDDKVIIEGGNKVKYKVIGFLSVQKEGSKIPNDYDSNNSYFLYEDEKGEVKKINAFDFDKICKCNSINSIAVGIYEF